MVGSATSDRERPFPSVESSGTDAEDALSSSYPGRGGGAGSDSSPSSYRNNSSSHSQFLQSSVGSAGGGPFSQLHQQPSQSLQSQQQQPPPLHSSTAGGASLGPSGAPPPTPTLTQIYCAACRNVSALRDSYACTECICGLCQACVDVLMAEQGARRKCPHCATIGGRFKPFNLDIR